ncbi:MAG: hypothetical protein KF819_15770 [Labilithrix sp.]|nr:hypothetical protein [Labilithrix sp.]
MLPFTKRPGRDDDAVTKDDLEIESAPVPPASKPAASPAARPFMKSASDDELTQLMPTKALGNSGAIAAIPSPRPAAGAPPPSRRPATVPPPAKSSAANRSGKFAAQDDEEEDGRTVVRGAPKIVKRGKPATMGMPTGPVTTISPAAVIKATLDSARSAKRTGEHLMAGPPVDLLEDLEDKLKEAAKKEEPHPADVGSEHTAILSTSGSMPMVQGVQALGPQMLQPQPVSHGTIPPGSARPMSVPPAPPSSQVAVPALSATQSGGYAVPYGGPPSAPHSVPPSALGPQSMPAHFMVPQAPYSDARLDPPGTAVTARTKVKGRPAMSWAVALLTFGLFVGVGAVAVMRGNAEGFVETSASFVDPSRAAKAAAAAPPAADPTPTPVPAETVAAPTVAVVGVPPVVVPPAPTNDPNAPPAAPPAAAPEAPPAVVAASPAAAPAAAPTTHAHAAPAQPKQPVAAAPAPRPAAAAPAPRPARPAPAPVAEEPAAAKPAKPGKPAPAAKGDPDLEAEQKKALKALQDSQLESTF